MSRPLELNAPLVDLLAEKFQLAQLVRVLGTLVNVTIRSQDFLKLLSLLFHEYFDLRLDVSSLLGS